MRVITTTLIDKRYGKNRIATGRATERKVVPMRICGDFIARRVQDQEVGYFQSSPPFLPPNT